MKTFFLALLLSTIINKDLTPKFPGGRGETVLQGKSSVYEFKNGRYTWYLENEIQVTGKYEVRGEYLIVTDLRGPRSCTSIDEEVAIYTWEIHNEKAYLSVVDDNCLGRQRGFLSVSLSN